MLRNKAPSTGRSPSPRQLIDVVGAVALQQAAEHEALTVAQFQRGRGLARGQARHKSAGDGHAVGLVDLAHLRLDDEIDHAVAQHRRGEGQADAVGLEAERRRAGGADFRDRNLAAGEEARGLARQRHQIGSARRRAAPFDFERVDLDLQLVRQLADQKAERRRAGQHAGGDHRRNGQGVPRHVGAADGGAGESWLLERAIRLRDRQLRGRQAGAGIGQHGIAERIPLHAEVAAGVAVDFDEAHFQLDLLRLHDLDGVDRIRAELARDLHRLVERGGIGRGAAQKDAAVDRRDFDAAAGEVTDLRRQPRNVVGHFDVENADRLVIGVVDGDARGADLLAEDGQRVIGQRADVGDVRIAHRDIGEGLIGPDVFGLADRHRTLAV